MFEKNLQIGYLLDFYGDVLSERRRDIMDMYYNDDMSLAEIADSMGITRQAVREAIKKTESELFFYEEKLHLVDKFLKAKEEVSKVNELALQLEETGDKSLIKEITKITENILEDM